jgi:NAD(P)-dependent dehydrogenase (short-subunit alcohol dehydrogenase family)
VVARPCDGAVVSAGHAVVVGATGALGSAIVARLRADGMAVVAVARHARPSSGARPTAGPGPVAGSGPSAGAGAVDGAGVTPCAADIGSDDAVGAIAAALDAAGAGTVRMVVQAAGLPAAGPVETIDPDALGHAVALKAGGLLRLVRAVDDRLAAGSRIVALGGHYGSEPAPYACAAGVTNAALANLVRQLAVAYGPRGITAHLVAPGPADTPRLRGLSAQAAQRRGVPVEQVLAERAAESPLGRLVTPAEVAWSVAMLLAPEADALHGSTLALDVGARRGIF